MDSQCTNRVQSPAECGLTVLQVPESSTGASPSVAAPKEVNNTMPRDGDLDLFDCSVESHDVPTSERDGTGSPTFTKQNVDTGIAPHTCFGCKKALGSGPLVKTPPNLVWHADCLLCCECRENLCEGPSCHIKEGNAYCKRDYLKLVGIHCSKCQQKLLEDDLVMKANGQIFHKGCFTCSVCQHWLEPGEEAAIKRDGLYCSKHTPDDATASEGDSTKQEHTKNEDKVPVRVRVGKKPRQRTVLSEEQLALLKHYYYNVDRKPSTPLKEEICKKTNLSMRVVRVWFQNKRCKEKKDRLRQDGWDLVAAQQDTLPPTTGPILFNPYLPHPSVLSGTPRMDGISHEQYSLYCNQPYAAMTATPPRHLQYATPLPQYPSPATAPPLSLPSTTHTLYYNMSNVPGGNFPVSRCSPTEASTVCPASPYSAGDPPACPSLPQGVLTGSQLHY